MSRCSYCESTVDLVCPTCGAMPDEYGDMGPGYDPETGWYGPTHKPSKKGRQPAELRITEAPGAQEPSPKRTRILAGVLAMLAGRR